MELPLDDVLNARQCPHLAMLLRSAREVHEAQASFYGVGVKRNGWALHLALPGRLEQDRDALRGAGLDVDGEIGDPDPVAAVQDAANGASYDEVIVSTLHKHVSRWLKLDLPSKAAHATGLPVTHVEARARAHA